MTAGEPAGGGRSRGQLVLVAAAVVAVALVPMTFAYLSLSAHPDVDADAASRPGASTVPAVERAVANASRGVSGSYPASDRGAALDAFDAAAAGDLRAIERSRLRESVAVDVARNASAAATWSATNCPGGPNREFGGCAATDGVVTQRRVGDVHVVAVAVTVTVTEPRGVSRLTVVVTVP